MVEDSCDDCTCKLKIIKRKCAFRKFTVAANWKMNGDTRLVADMGKLLKQGPLDRNTAIILAVPYIYLERLKNYNLPSFCALAAQNCSKEEKGPLSGEISPAMLVDIDVPWVILGHSERRTLFGESDYEVALKLRAALKRSLKAIVCVGESIEERESGRTMQVIQRQLKVIADAINDEDWNSLVIAYEPLWTNGKTVTSEEAEEVHLNIRNWICNYKSLSIATKIRILYGGSVSSCDSSKFVKHEDIDGFLMGGASLKPGFIDICNSMSELINKVTE